MKILLSAYACEAGRGSEPGVGWNTAVELAKYHEVWVLTRPDDGREAIEAELARHPQPNLHFVYFTLPIFGHFWQWGSVAFVLHYYLWQIQAYFVAKKLHRQLQFDVAHHVTFVRYSSPSFISLLPIPFVWGTVGGAEAAPKPFWKNFSWRAKGYEILRALAHKIGEQDPFARLTAKRSAIARVTTEDTARQVRKMGAAHVMIVPEAALSQPEIETLFHFPLLDTSPIRFISMGRLLHWKGFDLGIKAFAQANLPDAEYWILGEGIEAQNLYSLAQQWGVENQVKFWGRLTRSQTFQQLSQCQVLVHPSLHDSGGWVCLEAMAAGRPILCFDLGGPGVQVTPETGIKIPAHTPEQAVQDLSKAMVYLAQDSQLRSRMGKAGQEIVQNLYNWEIKGQELSKLYQELRCKNKITTHP